MIEYKFATEVQDIAPCSLFESAVIGLNFRVSNQPISVSLTFNFDVYNRHCFS